MKNKKFEYPDWICSDCGHTVCEPKFKKGESTFHNGTCGVCGEVKAVTQLRDFGYPPIEKLEELRSKKLK